MHVLALAVFAAAVHYESPAWIVAGSVLLIGAHLFELGRAIGSAPAGDPHTVSPQAARLLSILMLLAALACFWTAAIEAREALTHPGLRRQLWLAGGFAMAGVGALVLARRLLPGRRSVGLFSAREWRGLGVLLGLLAAAVLILIVSASAWGRLLGTAPVIAISYGCFRQAKRLDGRADARSSGGVDAGATRC